MGNMVRVYLIPSVEQAPGPKWTAIRGDNPGILGVGDTQEVALLELDRAVEEYRGLAEEQGWEPLAEGPTETRVVTDLTTRPPTTIAVVTMASARALAGV